MSDHPRYFDLSRFALIEVAGDDAFTFLHGQFTADLNDLEHRGWIFSAWCQANGRVLCTFIVFRKNHALFLLLPAAIKEKIIRRLSLFVLRSKVNIRDATADHIILGLRDINIRNMDLFGSCKCTGNMLAAENCNVLELWGQTPRSIVICKQGNLHLLMEKIHMLCKPGEPAAWDLLDIEAGIPWITEPTSDSYLPQMLNLDQMLGLSYQKGCYPGQEVIARLHYRGALKRRLFLGTGHGENPPPPGTGLVQPDTGARTGDVIDAARHPDGSFRLLVVAGISEAESGVLRLQDAQQTSITLQPLQYPLPATA